MNYISTKSDNPIKSYDIKCGTKSAKKKSPTRPTWHGDFLEQARVSNLVSTPKVSLEIDLSNPHNILRIWGGRPDGVLNSAGITQLQDKTFFDVFSRKPTKLTFETFLRKILKHTSRDCKLTGLTNNRLFG